MNTRNLIPLAASILSIAIGCTQVSPLDSDLSEAQALLTLDKAAVEVEAASFYADDTVKDTVTVSSSRSWSLASVTESDWLNISRDNGLNLGKVMKDWKVGLEFTDNLLPEDRQVDLSITIEGERVLLPVIQKGFTPILALESADTYNIPELGDTVTLNIKCNSNWTAAVDGSSTARIALGAEAGYKSSALDVIVKGNTDITSGKEATVIISAEGLEEKISVSFAQDICIPYVTIDQELTDTYVVAGGGASEVVFSTNVNWTAALEDASAGVTLSATEGAPEDQLFVNFPAATLDGASATVVITGQGDQTDRITFTQEGCLFVTFRKWPDNNGWSFHSTDMKGWDTNKYDIPRSPDDSKKYLETNETYVGKDLNGYKFVFFGGKEDGMFRSEACGLVIGSITQNPAFYIEFPAIEGKTLKEVKIMLGNSDVKMTNQEATATGTSGCITSVDGKIVDGGKMQTVGTYQRTEEWTANESGQLVQPSFWYDYYNHTSSLFHFVLTGTEPGTAYRFAGEYRMVIRWFILYYE